VNQFQLFFISDIFVLCQNAEKRFGSFIWKEIDGEQNIYEIGQKVKEHFGKEADPLYERLTTFFRILAENKYITLLSYSIKRISADSGSSEPVRSVRQCFLLHRTD